MPDKPKKETPNNKPRKKASKKAAASKKVPSKKHVKGKPAPVKKKLPISKEVETLQQILQQARPQDTIGQAINILHENLGSYVVLGYTFNGDPITAVAATTPQEYDALYTRVVTFLQSKPAPNSQTPPLPPDCGDLGDIE